MVENNISDGAGSGIGVNSYKIRADWIAIVGNGVTANEPFEVVADATKFTSIGSITLPEPMYEAFKGIIVNGPLRAVLPTERLNGVLLLVAVTELVRILVSALDAENVWFENVTLVVNLNTMPEILNGWS